MTVSINYQAWALYENLDVYTAASLWCDRNPYYVHQWEHFEYVEVRNLILQIIKHLLDAENYPIDKRNFVIIELGRRFDIGIDEFFNECKKFIVSRNQLKEIAKKCGVRPKFLFDYGSDNEASSKYPGMGNKSELTSEEISDIPSEPQNVTDCINEDKITATEKTNNKIKFEYPETKAWKEKAREIGKTWMEEKRKEGVNPGIIEISKYVEGELSNLGLTGARGKYLDWETIKKEALTGITGKPANGKAKKS